MTAREPRDALDAFAASREKQFMQRDQLLELLKKVQAGQCPPQDAAEALAHMPFSDDGVAKVDHHRGLRCGFAEVVFGPGKRPEDIVAVVQRALKGAPCILTSRVSESQVKALRRKFPKAVYNPKARTVRVGKPVPIAGAPEILVVTAGTSDIPVAEEALETLRAFGAPCAAVYDVGVAGLHRTLHALPKLRNAGVIICIAGMEGALPSVVGGLVSCPVIAVPTSVGYGASFDGLTPLLAMLNTCASGVSVVNIDNGFGAAMCALRIIARFAQKSPSAAKPSRKSRHR